MSDQTPPLEPLFKNVLCEREAEEKYSGSLYIPETAKEKPMGARVIACGSETERVMPGDFVLCGRYSGADLKFNNKDYVVLRESEILAIVNEPEGE